MARIQIEDLAAIKELTSFETAYVNGGVAAGAGALDLATIFALFNGVLGLLAPAAP